MLLKIKIFIAEYIYYFIKKINLYKYKIFLSKCKSYDKLLIFDLDNTLADTFPNLKAGNKSEMYRTLPVHLNMINVLKSNIKANETCIILTAREFKYKEQTKYWLNSNLNKKNIPLFMVLKAKDKLPYLNQALKKFDSVVYYDDLSYNQEKGEVKFYDKLINEINSMPIQYYGYQEINKINKIN